MGVKRKNFVPFANKSPQPNPTKMSCKLLLVLYAVICIIGTLKAASLGGAVKQSNAVKHKLDFKDVEANVRTGRQAYIEDDSAEDSDEDDEEEDAEIQHQNVIRHQQAYDQSVDDSQEGSDEDDDGGVGEDNDGDYYGRRLKRDVSEIDQNNEVKENSKPFAETANNDKQTTEESFSTTSTSAPPTSGSPNTSVLILIRDAIKKVTELPNTQQVATSAQQYFQLFEYFLQQTIEQVIGDDDDEDEVESTTIVSEPEKDGESETNNKLSEPNDKTPETDTTDKESSAEHIVPQPEKKPEEANKIKA